MQIVTSSHGDTGPTSALHLSPRKWESPEQKDAAVDRCDSLSDVVASLQDRGTRLL